MWIKQLAPSIFSVMVQSFCRRGILGKLGKGGKDMVVKGRGYFRVPDTQAVQEIPMPIPRRRGTWWPNGSTPRRIKSVAKRANGLYIKS